MLDVDDPDFYEWETHIFFDDAFERNDSGGRKSVEFYAPSTVYSSKLHFF